MKLEILKHQSDKTRFIESLKDFIKPFYKSGIPSLFNKLKQLYKGEKSQWIQEALLEVENQIQKDNRIDENDEEEKIINPSIQLWNWMILA